MSVLSNRAGHNSFNYHLFLQYMRVILNFQILQQLQLLLIIIILRYWPLLAPNQDFFLLNLLVPLLIQIPVIIKIILRHIFKFKTLKWSLIRLLLSVISYQKKINVLLNTFVLGAQLFTCLINNVPFMFGWKSAYIQWSKQLGLWLMNRLVLET